MAPQLDIPRFLASTGGMDLLAIIGAAYVRQLPQWRAEFASNTEVHDTQALAGLAHKMKGSCYAVGAHAAAAEFEAAEVALAHGTSAAWATESTRLMRLVEDIEQELLAVIAAQAK